MQDLSKISVVLPSLDPDDKLSAVIDGLLEVGFQDILHLHKCEDRTVFVMGDNRIVSIDSRELGCINEETVMGKAVLRLFPFNQIGGLYK